MRSSSVSLDRSRARRCGMMAVCAVMLSSLKALLCSEVSMGSLANTAPAGSALRFFITCATVAGASANCSSDRYWQSERL